MIPAWLKGRKKPRSEGSICITGLGVKTKHFVTKGVTKIIASDWNFGR
jgi:hypothetical protein